MRRFLTTAVLVAVALVAGFMLIRDDTSGPSETATPQTLEQGKIEFDRHCRTCHSKSRRITAYLSRQPDETRRAELIEFLSHHGASSDQADVQIADYLISVRK